MLNHCHPSARRPYSVPVTCNRQTNPRGGGRPVLCSLRPSDTHTHARTTISLCVTLTTVSSPLLPAPSLPCTLSTMYHTPSRSSTNPVCHYNPPPLPAALLSRSPCCWQGGGGEVECVTIDSTRQPRRIIFFLSKVIFFVLDLIRLGLLLLLLFWPVCEERESW